MTLSTSDFELLLQANRILSSKLDTSDVLKAVMELATKVVRAEASSLLLLDEANQELYIDVALGSAKDSVKQIRVKVGEGIAGWVAKEKKPLIVNDVLKDPRFTGKVDKATKFVTRSILAVPLLAKGRLVGVVEALNKEFKGVFSGQDQEAFEVFASQAAVAIENARLFSEVVREKEKLNTVFAQMSDGILLLDAKGVVVLMNEAGQNFVNHSPSQIMGKKFNADLFPGYESASLLNTIPGINEKGKIIELERHEGKDFFIHTTVIRIDTGFLVLLRDVTEEKRGEKLKRNFLSLISHKLKTPLTVILGYGPILLENSENLSASQKSALKAVCEKGEQLGSLVDKLLRYTTVESGSIKPSPGDKPLRPLIEEAAKMLDASVQIDPSLSPQLKGYVDGNLTIEIFKNLFENALKFNNKDDKKINVFARENDESTNFIEIEVQDNGVGIPVEEREKVFQKFYQIENSFTGQVPGAGLGLALCKKAIEAMDGKIHLESNLGDGTRVILHLPRSSK